MVCESGLLFWCVGSGGGASRNFGLKPPLSLVRN